MEAHDPEAALKLAENFQAGIDLLISDVVMPGMTGSELSERLRQTYPQMQTIYISAYDRREAVVAKASAGAVFLQKPFTPAQLKQAVAHVLNTHGDFANLTATSPSPGEWTC
jgi:CheY-like chemotaxis protein